MKLKLKSTIYWAALGALVGPLACNQDVVIPTDGSNDEVPKGFSFSAQTRAVSDPTCQQEVKGKEGLRDSLTLPTPAPTGQVDVLFVVDNSLDTPAQQQHFVDAGVELIDRLARPGCVGTSVHVDEEGNCPEGSTPEFAPVEDIHVGVITTSLGFQPNGTCEDGERNDRAYLIPRVRSGAVDPLGNGHLKYSGDVSTLQALKDDFTNHLELVGTDGCGFESPLEATYRFLVDPTPFESLTKSENQKSVPEGLDESLLEQRNAFLRPNSAVLVVLLTNEDDCSSLTGDSHYPNADYGWLATDTNFAWPQATKQCEEDPNDPCCQSCLQVGASECDPACDELQAGNEPNGPEDPLALRCFDQKRRLGVDMLYPVERYIQGFSEPVISAGRCGAPTFNPLFVSGGEWTRSPRKIFFTSIVGAPFQDLATAESLTNEDHLEYLNPLHLARNEVSVGGRLVSRWDLLVGDRSSNQAPLDPFMIESIEPRAGSHPLVEATMVSPEGPGSNSINGHEFYASGWPTLQRACIAPLATPRECAADDVSCDCATEPDLNQPICKEIPQAELTATTTQYFTMAVPSRRILEVTRGLGAQGIPASVCAKSIDAESAAYGYRPVVEAALTQVKGVLPPLP